MNQITSLSEPAPERLILPDGRPIDTVPQGPLYSEFARLAIPGFAHTHGRGQNERAYADHLRSIAEAAGRAAISERLGAHRSA